MNKKRIGGWSALALVLVGGVWGYQFIRSHSFSAREKPTAFEASLARRLRWLATPSGVRDLKNPVEATELNIAEARDHFADHCAVCHANDGSGDTQIGAGLYPPPPDMRDSATQSLTDGELFYIIKNGIRFTGMPGWGGEGDENWNLVAFIRHLPELSEFELQLMNEVNSLGSSGEQHEH